MHRPAMRPATVLILVATVVAATIAGCGGMRRSMQEMHAPQPERVEGSLAEMSVGEFFRANCAVCHGERRQGSVGPPLLPVTLTEDDEFYFDVIANGRPGTAMPAWSALGLAPGDIDALIRFLRTEP